jgi:hypothetical protein
MTMTLVIAVNAILDLGIVLGLFAVMGTPFRLDRRPRATKAVAQVHPLPEPAPLFDVELAA